MNHPSRFSRLLRSVWMKRFLGVVLLVVVFIAGAALSSSDYSTSSPYDDSYYQGSGSAYTESEYSEYEEVDSDSKMITSPTGSATYDESLMSLDTEIESQRRIIKTASISIDVKSTEETMSALSTIVDQYGGFVQSSSTWAQGDSTTAGSAVLRVDADQFEETMENIRGLATVVNGESISGEDVSEEYIDLESRLTNLRAEEKQYLLILGEATTVEDLLMVSDYLSSVRGEIETIEGRLKYLDNQTDLSTITVSVYEEASVIIPTSDWRPIEVAEEAFNRLVVFAQGLVDLLIWVVIFGIPAWVAWSVVRGLWRWWNRRHSGSRK